MDGLNYAIIAIIGCLSIAIYLLYTYKIDAIETIRRFLSTSYSRYKDELYEVILLLCPDEYDERASKLIDIAEDTNKYVMEHMKAGMIDFYATVDYVIELLEDIGFEVGEKEEKVIEKLVNVAIKWMQE